MPLCLRSSTVPTRPPLRLMGVLLGACGALLLSAPSLIAEAESIRWVPSTSLPPGRASDDLELCLRTRKLLLQDDVLAGQALGVSIRNRVATLWGPVPSARVARRAEECMRNLPGVYAVKNELTIDPGGAPRAEAPAAPRAVPGALVHRTEEPTVLTRPTYAWRPARGTRPDTLPDLADEAADKPPCPEKPSAPSFPGYPVAGDLWHPKRAEESIVVMPALRLPSAPSVAASARARPPAAHGSGASGLAQAIESLRLADDRLRGVHVNVDGNVVYLTGTVYCWEHLFEFARLLSRLPGTPRVLFDQVHAESSPRGRPSGVD